MATADVVTLTLESGDGERRDYSFSVDDYRKRSADGGTEAYLRERAFPKIRAGWTPDFTEVDRRVVYGVDPEDPAAMDAARKSLGVVHVGKAHATAGVG
jgi:hypothetical protein